MHFAVLPHRTFGTLFVNGLAWIMLDDLGWRYLVGFCSIPVALAMASFPFLPESPHWLLLMGRPEEALAVVRKAAALNGKTDALPASARLVISHDDAPATTDGKTYEIEDKQALLADGASEEGGDAPSHSEVSPLMLFDKTNRAVTMLLWATWCSSGFTYYGMGIAQENWGGGGSWKQSGMFSYAVHRVI